MFRKFARFSKFVLKIPLRPQSRGRRICLLLRAIPKTIFFNFKYFKFKDALRFPIWISHRVHLMHMGGTVVIDAPVKFGMVRIGFAENNLSNVEFDRNVWDVWGKVVFKGPLVMGLGNKITIQLKEAVLSFGSNILINVNNQFCCDMSITFGDHLRVGWENLFMDTAYHNIRAEGKILNPPKPILIGNHVWITSRCGIFQGTELPDESIVGYGSVLSWKYTKPKSLISGYPGRVVLEGIEHDELQLEYFQTLVSEKPAISLNGDS